MTLVFFGQYNVRKLLIIDGSIVVLVGKFDNLLDFLLVQSNAEMFHYIKEYTPEMIAWYVAIFVLVKHAERLANLAVCVHFAQFSNHEHEKFRKVQGACIVTIYFIDPLHNMFEIELKNFAINSSASQNQRLDSF